MSFTPAELQKIKDAFNEFARKTDHPREKIITSLSTGKRYSAKQIAKGLQKK